MAAVACMLFTPQPQEYTRWLVSALAKAQGESGAQRWEGMLIEQRC